MKYFKQAMGVSFTSYLNSYRLTMAARLLLQSDATVLSIATEVGFDNLSYFNRVFKRQFHATPSDFRRGNEQETR
jgi:AraC-like DNA-binding protein